MAITALDANAQFVHVAARLAAARPRWPSCSAAVLLKAQITRKPVAIVRVEVLANPWRSTVLPQLDAPIDHTT
jgi:hypothetical protein